MGVAQHLTKRTPGYMWAVGEVMLVVVYQTLKSCRKWRLVRRCWWKRWSHRPATRCTSERAVVTASANHQT